MKLALISAAWLGGVSLGLSSAIGTIPLLLMASACGMAAAGLRLARVPVMPSILVAVLLLGMARAESSQSGPDPLRQLYGEEVTVTGCIVDDPETTARQVRFEVEVSRVQLDGNREVADDLWLVYASPRDDLVSRRKSPYFRYGDEVTIKGIPREPQPFDGFDYAAYLSAQGITATMFAREARVIGEREGSAGGL